MPEAPDVDVVVTHYCDETRLAWVLEALAAQDYPRRRLHVVVADDGSPRLPRCADTGSELDVRVVAQPDQGFRAAAARNLGARQGHAPYLVFLDGDTVPEPGFCRALVEQLQELATGPGGLVTGRRRHADLSAVAGRGEDVPRWVSRAEVRRAGDLLTDPQWLVEGHARTDDLTHAGPDDWRLVISATMGMTRAAFDAIGGFDATLVGYGGEDWDLAYRAWNAGVTLRHCPEAIAWHDGGDAAERAGFAETKEHEQLALASRIPQPSVRGRGGIWPVPRITVSWPGTPLAPSAEYAAVESWLRLADVGIWRRGGEWSGPLQQDPRMHVGSVPDPVAARAEFVVDVHEPCVLRDAAGLVADLETGPVRAPEFTAMRTREQILGCEPGEAERGADSHRAEALPPGARVDLESHARRWWS